ncbi:MAG TPA: DNA replication/repair protein RecF [Candidatus Solibacter sp.]|jgi:DNA replication and repair protein RecF|nr:DNA replication/repair protein RecF [Candidatus Solibacter sp.]
MITSVSLFAFRNYLKESVPLRAGVNLLLGANAQGKTNLLEAVYLGATGRSPRATVLAEMVMWEQAGARVRLEFDDDGAEHSVEVRLERDDSSRRTKRSLVLDGKPVGAQTLAGRLRMVLFSPEEMTLIRGSGEGRRRLLNGLLTQADADYAATLSRYSRVLEQRNQLIKRIAQDLEPIDTLAWWSAEISRLGGELVRARRRAIDELIPVVAAKYAEVAPGEQLALRYAPNVVDDGDPEAAIAAELARRQREEIARGLTVAGPHRDDLEFELGGLPAAAHASQGQQRTAILAFKLAEVEVLSAGPRSPVLLLDDVMSELDAPRRQHLVELVEASPQAIITSAEEGYFPPGFVDRVHTRRVVSGHLVAASG